MPTSKQSRRTEHYQQPDFAARSRSRQHIPLAHHAPRCNHIRPNGLRCGSPAMRQNPFCYFHNRYHEGLIDDTFPPLEDGNGVQVALMYVTERLRRAAFAGGEVNVPVVKQLLYGLQTAAYNLRHTSFDPVLDQPLTAAPWTLDRENGLLPPKQPPASAALATSDQRLATPNQRPTTDDANPGPQRKNGST